MSFILSIIIFLIPSLAAACVGCAGSMDNPRDLTYIYVLGGFILLVYIPFYIIYRTIKNNEGANELQGNETQQVD